MSRALCSLSLEHLKNIVFQNRHFMQRRGPATSRTSLGVGVGGKGCPEVLIPEAAASWPAVHLSHLKLLFQGVCKAESLTGRNT